MAPEVALNEPYGLSADLYSFSVVMWELLALDKAFGQMSVDEHKRRVLRGTKRLPISWSHKINQLLVSGWDRNPFNRPSAGHVKETLRQEVKDLASQEFPLPRTTNTPA